MLEMKNLKLSINYTPGQEVNSLKHKISKMLHISIAEITDLQISKKSIDARNKEQIKLVYTVKVKLNDHKKEVIYQNKYKDIKVLSSEATKSDLDYPKNISYSRGLAPIVVGSGPAGMFAALVLAEAGLCPIILERGTEVEQRTADVLNFWQKGILEPESNVQFGEGGAGTFSDGKLTTGIKDIYCKRIIKEFVEAGAPKEIAYLAKPHIGTDELRKAVINIRNKILNLGGEYRFGHKLIELIIKKDKIAAVQIQNEDITYELATNQVILALGHSARDTFAMLNRLKIPMAAKAFSIGVRIEHPQSLINLSQYGKAYKNPNLGAADYKLSCHLSNGRSVYTFCMCPGGQVVAAASELGGVVTNGMSNFARDGKNANSALLVGITPADFASSDPLAGINFQRKYESLAYALAGSTYAAPMQLTKDFLVGKSSTDLGDWQPTYKPGIIPTDLSQCLPNFVIESLREALPIFDRKLNGFAHPQGIMTGVETRSSSPLRILRDQTMQSSIRGLYPSGEGAGYAGGIISAASDGFRCAEAILKN